MEPARAARFGIKHYCWIGLNAKEAENPELAAAVGDLGLVCFKKIPQWGAYSRKLGNASFLERAPEEVVRRERELQQELALRKERIERHLAALEPGTEG